MKQLALALAALVVTAAVSARPHHPPPGALPESLALTPSQQVAWERSEENFRATVDPLHDRIRALEDALETALDASDATTAGETMLQIHALHGQIRAARQRADAQFIPLLTSEQREGFAAFRAAEESRRKHGPGGGGRRP
jgi:hypothetical protein